MELLDIIHDTLMEPIRTVTSYCNKTLNFGCYELIFYFRNHSSQNCTIYNKLKQ